MANNRQLPRLWLPFFRRSPRSGALAVHTDFEGGNAAEIEVLSPSHLRFAARADSSPRPMWFSFCLQDARAPAVRCDLVNADRCLGPRSGWATARPVFSPDGVTWQRVARANYVEERPGSGLFSFTVPIVSRATYVAYCYPYTTTDLEAFLKRLSLSDRLRNGELCRSGEERPVRHLRLGNQETPERTVWVLARQHAGETPGSYAMEGMLRELCTGASALAPLLDSTAFHLVPMLDVDGVYHGRYGKDQEPVDYNRDWRDYPVLPETVALLRAIRESHQRAPVGLVLDLHAPHHGDTSIYLFGHPPECGQTLTEAQSRLVQSLCHTVSPRVGFRAADLRTDYRPDRSAREYLWRSLQIPVITVELSYHLSQNGNYLTPEDYRQFGGALIQAMPEFFANH